MALIPPQWLDSVVAIGIPGEGGTRWTASGFLYGHFLAKLSDEQNQYAVFLVTNRHVLEGSDTVQLRFNPEEEEPAREYGEALVDEKGTRIWFSHPKVDVAVVPLNGEKLRKDGIRFAMLHSNSAVLDMASAANEGVSEGDGVFVLGFPLGLVGGERSYVIVRQGSIARIRDAMGKSTSEFLVDASVFPGSSGGPVIIKPEVVSIEGTKSVKKASLLGVVSGYLPYLDEAKSVQTGLTRVIFQENSGLAVVVPVDYVQETISEAMRVLGQKELTPMDEEARDEE